MFKKFKIPYFDIVIAVIITFTAILAILNIGKIWMSFAWVLGRTFSLLSTIIVGMVIAYLVNPIVNIFERQFKFKRGISIILTYIIVLALLSFFIFLVIPQVVDNAVTLFNRVPDYYKTVQNYFYDLADNLPDEISASVTNAINEVSSNLLNNVLRVDVISAVGNWFVRIFSSIFSFAIGLIVSIYVLLTKDRMAQISKGVIRAFLSQSKSEKVYEFFRKINLSFSRFFVGMLIDSMLIGVLAFIGFSLLGVPYALLNAVVIGLTNMIPMIGPIFGAVCVLLLTLLASEPLTTLLVLILIIALQTFDGYIFAPKFIGRQVGTNPLLIITAVLVGGGLAGVMGAFVAVPIAAVICVVLINDVLQPHLERRGVNFESLRPTPGSTPWQLWRKIRKNKKPK